MHLFSGFTSCFLLVPFTKDPLCDRQRGAEKRAFCIRNISWEGIKGEALKKEMYSIIARLFTESQRKLAVVEPPDFSYCKNLDDLAFESN